MRLHGWSGSTSVSVVLMRSCECYDVRRCCAAWTKCPSQRSVLCSVCASSPPATDEDEFK